MPGAGGLAGDAELAGDLGGVDSSSKQLGGAQPAGLQLLAFTVGLGAAGAVAIGCSCGSDGQAPTARLHPVNPIPKPILN
jgi:hypothetical protein